MMYLIILAISLALYISLRALPLTFAILVSGQKARLLFLRIFPAIEMILWFMFIFWAMNQLFGETEFYPFMAGSLIIVLVAIIGWYFLRDYISGIIFKADHSLEPGHNIVTSSISGTIKQLGYRSIQIITNEGEDISITYTSLINEKIRKPSDKGKYAGRVINLKISPAYQAEKIQNMLKRRMLEIPWIISGDSIKIRLAREEEYYIAEIHYQSVSPETALKTEENIQNFVKEYLT